MLGVSAYSTWFVDAFHTASWPFDRRAVSEIGRGLQSTVTTVPSGCRVVTHEPRHQDSQSCLRGRAGCQNMGACNGRAPDSVVATRQRNAHVRIRDNRGGKNGHPLRKEGHHGIILNSRVETADFADTSDIQEVWGRSGVTRKVRARHSTTQTISAISVVSAVLIPLFRSIPIRDQERHFPSRRLDGN